MRFFSGLIFGVLLVLLGFVIVFATGSYNVSALSSPSKFEKSVATFTLDRSVALARRVGIPELIMCDAGHAAGPRMRDYGGFGDPASAKRLKPIRMNVPSG